MTDSKIRICWFCGNSGVLCDDIGEAVSDIGTPRHVWACKDVDACFDRQVLKGLKPSYYRTTEQIKEQENAIQKQKEIDQYLFHQLGIKDSWQKEMGR